MPSPVKALELRLGFEQILLNLFTPIENWTIARRAQDVLM